MTLRSLGGHDGNFSQAYQDRLIKLLVNDFNVNEFCVEVGFNASELLEGSLDLLLVFFTPLFPNESITPIGLKILS